SAGDRRGLRLRCASDRDTTGSYGGDCGRRPNGAAFRSRRPGRLGRQGRLGLVASARDGSDGPRCAGGIRGEVYLGAELRDVDGDLRAGGPSTLRPVAEAVNEGRPWPASEEVVTVASSSLDRSHPLDVMYLSDPAVGGAPEYGQSMIEGESG